VRVVIPAPKRYNPDLDMAYEHTEAEHAGHLIEVNKDERGHHVRLDRGPIFPNLDELGVVQLICRIFGGEPKR
jgi:hypothetical protein